MFAFYNRLMIDSLPLKEMTVAEKIELMEKLWEELSSKDSSYAPPAWHGEVLAARKKMAERGEAGFTEWEVSSLKG